MRARGDFEVGNGWFARSLIGNLKIKNERERPWRRFTTQA